MRTDIEEFIPSPLFIIVDKKKKPLSKRTTVFLNGRGDEIRTHDLYVPNVALYQTEPHLENDTPACSRGIMAAELGFEPRQTESESAVLPLHNSAMLRLSSQRERYLLYQVSFKCQYVFSKKFLKSCFKIFGCKFRGSSRISRMNSIRLVG